MLKGFLCANDEKIPFTHDLMKLNRLCVKIDETFEDLLEPCSNLMPYGVQVRYPNNVKLLEEDMRMAIKDASKICNMITPKIEIIIGSMENE